MFADLFAFAARHREYARVREELSRLDDHDLADLGVQRYEIERIARQSAYDLYPRAEQNGSDGLLNRLIAYAGRVAV